MISWVIYGHTYMLVAFSAENPLHLSVLLASRIGVMVEMAFYSVDVFFFLGGFFAAFVLVKKLKNVSI